LRKEAARKAVRMLSAAMEEGVLPGGGAAYLACRAAVRAEKAACSTEEEAQGVEVVASALEAPFCQILRNDGRVSPALALERAGQLGPGWGFDLAAGELVDMAQAGILDSAGVVQGALQAAASAAALLLTTDVIVLRKET
jgi:chaperonin GroEL